MSANRAAESNYGFAPGVVDRFCSAFADGIPIKRACVVSGMGGTTLAEWREQHPELEERLSEARELARQKAPQAIKSAGEKDWRAWDAWLRNAFPADYRGSGSKIEVSAAAMPLRSFSQRSGGKNLWSAVAA